MLSVNCYCGSGKLFVNCCQPYIIGVEKAPTAEALMRSRYSAYVVQNADYLWVTTAPKERRHHSKSAMLEWSRSNQWIKLEVLNTTETTVEFKAYYIDNNLEGQIHHEKSNFIKQRDSWFYVDGEY